MANQEIRHFTQLIVWQKANQLVLEIYQISKKFPNEEVYGITSQIRRAVVSITCNIAEGFGRYHYKDKIRFYYLARGSNMEVQNLLILCGQLGYVDNNKLKGLKILSYEGYKLLNGFIKSVQD